MAYHYFMTNAYTFRTDGFPPFQHNIILATKGQYPNEKTHQFNGCHQNDTNTHKSHKHYTHVTSIYTVCIDTYIYIYIYTRCVYIYWCTLYCMYCEYVEMVRSQKNHEISAVRSNNRIIPIQFISAEHPLYSCRGQSEILLNFSRRSSNVASWKSLR